MSENMQQCPNCGEFVPAEYVTCVWCAFDLTTEKITRAGIIITNKDVIDRAKRIIRYPVQVMKEISIVPDRKGGRYSLILSALLISLHMALIISKIKNFGIDVTASYGKSILGNIVQFFLSLVPMTVLIALGTLFFFIFFNVTWRFASRFIRMLSRLLGGGSEKEKMMAVTGYSTIPITLGWAVTLPLRLFSKTASVPDNPDFQAINSAITSIATTGIGAFITFVLIVCWLWTMLLAIIGVARAAKLSYIESAVAAGIPYGLAIFVIAS